MASITKIITPSDFTKISCQSRYSHVVSSGCGFANIRYCNVQQDMCRSLLFSRNPHTRCLIEPVSAVGQGLETSIADAKDDGWIPVKATVVVESQDEENLQVRVDITGTETQKVYDKVLNVMANNAPPVPGFRKQKGGKTAKVPKPLLLRILGEDNVTNFVIEEIVSSTMADYADKENLKVKDKKVDTIQTIEELKKLFAPGKDFGFNVKLQLEKSETDASESDASSSDEKSDDIIVEAS